MMPVKAKTVKGHENKMAARKAAQRLQEFGRDAQEFDDLRHPYRIGSSFSSGSRGGIGDQVITITGMNLALRALREMQYGTHTE
jgi:hypothetical protein